MSKGSSFIHRFKFTIAVSGVIMILSLMPGSTMPSISWSEMVSLDKWAHFFIYALLAFCWIYEWKRGETFTDWKKIFTVLALSALYGILLEYYQLIMNSGRYFEVLDIIANIIGSMAGLSAHHWLIKK